MSFGRAPVGLGLQGSGQLVGGAPDPGFFRAVAELAESVGYESLWAGDHVSFHNPILDVTVALACFAARTERIRIGAGVVLLPLRHPSLVARAFASLDYLSGGRVVLGVGVGGEGGKDFEAVGVAPGERGARTDEAMLALRELFRGPGASFSGRFFSFAGVTIEPAPAQPGGPPLWVGGRSPGALRRAGRLGDGWMPLWVSPERFADGLAEVRRHAQEAGRDPSSVAAVAVCPALVGERARERLAEHLAARYGMAPDLRLVERYCVAGTPAECAARVRAYVDAGAEHIVLNPGCAPAQLLDQAERLHAATALALQQTVTRIG
ncbi:MAG TPA: LLM class flavin-dependent oxidoreductase [Gaiellaceae bacterium]|nr:LLM class flavin-dependent oxidoreductase [Gaiellaceae bacterium]